MDPNLVIINNNNAQIEQVKTRLKKSICQISINNVIKGLGSLVILPINVKNRVPIGILTSYKILSREDLKAGTHINLNFIYNEPQTIFNYTIPQDSFVFACDFIEEFHGTFECSYK